MAKKFIAVYLDAKGMPFSASGPYHGEWTGKSADQAIAFGKRNKAAFMEVYRRTKQGDVKMMTYDFKKDQMFLSTPPKGSNIGPGYY